MVTWVSPTVRRAPSQWWCSTGRRVDFLVDFEPGSSLFDLLHLKDELTALLGFPVDVVSRRALKDRDEHIRREAVPL
jgi:predicted nucleotidyltransferase